MPPAHAHRPWLAAASCPSRSRAFAVAVAQPLGTSVDATVAFAFGRDTRDRTARSDVPGPGAYEVSRLRAA